MAQIHVLDSETIDKIAAGEVVERPSSVVKELVENAIDAGADAITVEAKDGGIEFIRVTDNGCGMEQDQLRTAFLRHATSKIENAGDLNHISSLGFRGEALSSISAVAKVEVITKPKDSITGSRILLEGAKEVGFEEVGAPDGTTFLMRNLFYNTPVRRKFLKQAPTEGGYIADLMEHLALSRPDISFKLTLGNQLKFHTSGNGDLKEVIYRLYGREVANALIPIQAESNGIKVEGYLGKPEVVRSNRNFEIYFINGRFIRSNVVAKSIEEGYKEYLMQHKFPLCVLHITMDTEQVDVNVHPSKMDVRFSDGLDFARFLSKSVKDVLQKQEMIPEARLESDGERKAKERQEKITQEKKRTPEPFEKRRTEEYRLMEETKYAAEQPKMQEFMQIPVWNRVKNGENATKMQGNLADSRQNMQIETFKSETSNSQMVVPNNAVLDIPQKAMSQQPIEEAFFIETSELKSGDTDEKNDGTYKAVSKLEIAPDKESAVDTETSVNNYTVGNQINLFEDKILTADNRSRFRIIGQVFETYWLVQFEDKLLMIDQHAAHEKVNYERLMKQFREKAVVSQTLMPPVIVSLSGQEESVLKEHFEVFLSLGFEIEDFGGSEYALRSVPVDLYGCNEQEMFLEVLDQLAEGTAFGGIRVIEEKIASMSCKAAVKGNSLLSLPEAEALIDELLTLDNPYNCPHGRPTIVSMTKYEMERKFKRVVN
ncbi:MAG: DNA mismatch repair endonuclease MutL [Acetatifactor sp.]|nr:DNA mismatch repair endonuclease MutL [Acetatifactor sp.]